MLANPLISIVMSVYNGSDKLPKSVQSILDQTFGDFEFIIVNDGSTDNSLENLTQYAKNDPRIVLINQENQGLTKALITGCQHALGKYIARQDADDFSHETRLEKQFQYLEANPAIGLLASRTRYIGPEDEPLESICRSSDPVSATHLLLNEKAGPPAHGSVMFRREIYEQAGGYRPQFYLGQDSDLWLRMVKNCLFACLDDELYFFRRHAGSVSFLHREAQIIYGRLARSCLEARQAGLSEQDLLKEAEQVSQQVQRARSENTRTLTNVGFNYLIGSRLSQDGHPSAYKYLWQVLSSNPVHFKAWYRLLELMIRSKFKKGKS